VEFRRRDLDEHGIVVDIGRAGESLREILAALNFRNLDEEAQFKGKNTTTEFLARLVFDRMAQQVRAGQLGPSARAIQSIRVTLHESHVAWAAFEGELTTP
jgi:6-pyruvoyltetrahydropterin/6-carboxytetrahydropterin synthase